MQIRRASQDYNLGHIICRIIYQSSDQDKMDRMSAKANWLDSLSFITSIPVP